MGASGTEAYLAGAKLGGANLSDVDLTDADMTGADLTGANLSGAKLGRANLTGADLTIANLGRAFFEPKSLPELRRIAAAKNLELLTYDENPDALFRLRKQFEDVGFRDQERRITYALKWREAKLSCAMCTSRKVPFEYQTRAILWSSDSILASCASFFLNKVFFDWTCQYGMSPGRPLVLGALLWFLCSLLYFGFIHTSGQAGLYRVYSQSVGEDPEAQRRVERILPLRAGQCSP